jgi:hypothetical protein
MLGIKKADELTGGDLKVIAGCLNGSCAFAAESFEKISETTLVPVAKNIIYSGTEIVMNNILKGMCEK